jgi:hypothetical protein
MALNFWQQHASHALRLPLQHGGVQFVQKIDDFLVLIVQILHANGVFAAPSYQGHDASSWEFA